MADMLVHCVLALFGVRLHTPRDAHLKTTLLLGTMLLLQHVRPRHLSLRRGRPTRWCDHLARGDVHPACLLATIRGLPSEPTPHGVPKRVSELPRHHADQVRLEGPLADRRYIRHIKHDG